MLNYYHSVMKEMVSMGDALSSGTYKGGNAKCPPGFPLTPAQWSKLKNAINYSLNNYTDVDWITFWDLSSMNVPLIPGSMALDAKTFDGDVFGAIMLLIHEPQHDISQHGLDWFTHRNIGPIVGPTNVPPGGSYYDKLWDFLHQTNCGGSSLWSQLKKKVGNCKCGPRPNSIN
jgi:hypothetical protein